MLCFCGVTISLSVSRDSSNIIRPFFVIGISIPERVRAKSLFGDVRIYSAYIPARLSVFFGGEFGNIIVAHSAVVEDIIFFRSEERHCLSPMTIFTACILLFDKSICLI